LMAAWPERRRAAVPDRPRGKRELVGVRAGAMSEGSVSRERLG
jgi:hypothetical protein